MKASPITEPNTGTVADAEELFWWLQCVRSRCRECEGRAEGGTVLLATRWGHSRPAHSGGYDEGLVAIDGSAPSHAAVGEVAMRPWPKNTALKILTVIHSTMPLVVDPAFVFAAIHVDQTEEQRHVAPALVEADRKQIANAAPNLSVSTKILEGTPHDVIVQEARDWNADLIVVGSHGYGRLKRLVLGSVAGAVVANAPCSVQVVRANHLLPRAESEAA